MKSTNFLRSAAPFRADKYLQEAKKAIASRPAKPIFDVLSPMPSHLLNVSLAEHLPRRCQPAHFARRLQAYNHQSKLLADAARGGASRAPDTVGPDLRCPPRSMSVKDQADNALAMPLGHHLVYFPPQAPGSRLAPDGADRDHCPGAPFVRRLWAGGSVTFADGWEERLRLDGRRAVCVESVEPPLLRAGGAPDADVPGLQGSSEKVLVDVVRRYGPVEYHGGGSSDGTARGKAEAQAQMQGEAADERAVAVVRARPDVEEVRRLVFLRESDGALADRPRKVVRSPFKADSSFTITPDARLLFHFSALTFNAHAIHIDPLYAREQEGHAGILVHGPLTLSLMLALVRSRLGEVVAEAEAEDGTGAAAATAADQGWHLLNLDYRNVAPLYAGEAMKVCLKLSANESDASKKKWHVWVEGPEGGLAVKGTAIAMRPIYRKTTRKSWA